MARPRKKKEEDAAVNIGSLLDDAPAKKSTKTLKFKTAIKNNSFDLLAQDKATQKKDFMAKVGIGDGFGTSAEVASYYLPVPWLALQYLIGRPGIPANSITEFIGQESVGKSSLVYALMGNFIANNIPCYYINSEPKALEGDWQARLVNTDPEKAEVIKSIIDVHTMDALDEMDMGIRSWITMQRSELGVPKDVPLVCIVDSITKLMTPDEYAASGVAKKKPGEKSSGTGVANIKGKMAAAASWMHNWDKTIKPFIRENNATIILVSGQNQDIDAGAAPSFIPKSSLAKYNKTRRGGNAINQSAALQFTITYKSAVKNTANEACGKNVLLYCAKNSYGPSFREIQYAIMDDRKENYNDIPGEYLQPAIRMDEAVANLLVDKKAFGLSLNRKRYSSAQLNIYEAGASTIIQAIESDPEWMQEAAEALSIHGYEAEESDTEPADEQLDEVSETDI